MEIVKHDDSTKIGDNACPACNYKVSAAAPADDKPGVPMPGDIVLCLNCAEVLQFTEDMDLKLCPAGVKQTFDADTQAMIRRHKAHIKNRGPIKK
jgi:hypothetical protein